MNKVQVVSLAIVAALSLLPGSARANESESDPIVRQRFLARLNTSSDLVKQGDALRKQGNNAAAVAAYQSAVNAFPLWKAHIGLADALAAEKRHAEAAEQYRQALRRQIDPETYFKLAIALSNIGPRSYKEALAAYEEGIRQLPAESAQLLKEEQFSIRALDKTRFQASACVGIGMMSLGYWRWDEAGEQFQQAIRLRPDFAPAYLKFGDALRRGNEMNAQAKAMYQKAMELGQGEVTARARKRLIK
jgi:tetratricopeptide (TPR) repeat protein